MARNYDKTYLEGLIAKAKKSWEGVDVDSYMKNLRDDSPDKEEAEKEDAEKNQKALENLRKVIEKAMRNSNGHL